MVTIQADQESLTYVGLPAAESRVRTGGAKSTFHHPDRTKMHNQ